ncbi:hypothetical protein B0A48_16178 [Cryoendolithus antarcticus]|uniref:DUF3669 domain-containing protein n=1 Tax=Cryoendolithus antarcticus TaxID=1507870 RepID=A0A1V8SFR1_9PEZI|nr:hypothetical protein B0A48_16178 [Cryoendolithus antarcticus]
METPTPLPFRQIGKGFCGSVWAADRSGVASAMKREDGGTYRSVTHDSTMHTIIEASLTRFQQSSQHLARRLNIPAHRQLITAGDTEWWQARSHRFPESYEHCNTLITERSLPFPEATRHKIIDLFCLPGSRDALKESRKDEDCLLRCYLGRRKDAFASPSRYFTLRNKPMQIHQLEGLGLPVVEYAETMADVLSVMYWHSKVDANDVELVLAPPREGEEAWESETIGPHRLWLLDFDCAKPMSMDDAGIEQAARAFYRNDPYYPRPDGEDKADNALWDIFVKRFLVASERVLGASELPGRMVEALERLGKERGLRRAILRVAETRV